MRTHLNNSSPSPQARFYFLHIPKTAGTTFNAILNEQFPASEVCPAYHLSEFLQISPCCLGKYRLFRGHFYFGIEAFLPSTPLYLTFLRDPVARFVSNYQHIRATPGHLLNRTSTLADFLNDEEACKRTANFQTRSIGLTLIGGEKSRYQRPGVPVLQMLQEAMPQQLSSHELLSIARHRLNSMAFVGITEKFAESMALLQKTFAWSISAEFKPLNVSPRKPEEISATCLEKIKDLNSLDVQLYEHAVQLFESRQLS